jgi:hypothetical protein
MANSVRDRIMASRLAFMRRTADLVGQSVETEVREGALSIAAAQGRLVNFADGFRDYYEAEGGQIADAAFEAGIELDKRAIALADKFKSSAT